MLLSKQDGLALAMKHGHSTEGFQAQEFQLHSRQFLKNPDRYLMNDKK